jgi:hypothetical protein
MTTTRRFVSVGLAILGVLGGGLVSVPSVFAHPLAVANAVRSQVVAPTPSVGTYSGLTPARLLDTRSANATVDGLSSGGGPVAAGSTTTVKVLGRGGVPTSGVSSVVLNVTVVDARGAGFVTVWPSGEGRPNASNVNFVSGQTIPNSVIAKVGSDGSISIFASATAHLLVDVSGWFAAAGGFTGLSPARILDSRSANATVDGSSSGGGVLAANSETRLPVLGRGGVPATGVDSVVFNVTAVDARGSGYMTVWPTGESRPNASNLNFVGGQTIANLVIGKVGADGSVSTFSSASTHVIVDVAGWFAPNSGFTGLTPARVMDTRSLNATVDKRVSGTGQLSARNEVRLAVLGRGGVPGLGVSSVVLNVTAVDPQEPGFLTIWPSGILRPNTSNLNFVSRQTIPNLIVARVGLDGTISIYTESSTHLVVDVMGWFAVGTNEADPRTVVLPRLGANFSIAGGQGVLIHSGPEPVEIGSMIATTLADGSAYYGRVFNIEPIAPVGNSPKAKRLVMVAVRLPEIFPMFDLTFRADTAKGGILSMSSLRTRPALTQPSGERTFASPLSCDNAVAASGSLSGAYDLGTFSYAARWSSTGPQFLEVSHTANLRASIGADFLRASSCSVRFSAIPKLSLPSIAFEIDGVPIAIKQSVELSVNGSITPQTSANLVFGTSINQHVGSRWTPTGREEAVADFSVTHSENQNLAINAKASIASVLNYSAASDLQSLNKLKHGRRGLRERADIWRTAYR